MSRPSYGPEAKKRSQQLFIILLDYANDALEGDEKVLDDLRSQIQFHWQTERRLVVRTKVRLLETLTKLAHTPLSSDQIKEALRRLADFLEILEDNRPHKGGSEVWHFTLNLWFKRSDRPANLRQFEQEWEQRRPLKSKQVAGTVPEGDAEPVDLWWHYCRQSLETQQYQQLTSDLLTVADGMTFGLSELYLPLGLLERQRRGPQVDRSGSPKFDWTDVEDSEGDSLCAARCCERLIYLEDFFQQLQAAGRQQVAIIGEPGAGKTTLLQKVAAGLLAKRALPIWISLADLQGETLENYLLQDWLKQVTRQISVTAALQAVFVQQVAQGRVWLLLDAVDEMALDAATALTQLGRQLRGWLENAHVVLTCRSNVWDSGKNALAAFRTYHNLSFSHGDGQHLDQVGQFIDRWFQSQPLGAQLRHELNHPKRKKIRDAVKNPLRLALLCRAWSLAQGVLPKTKAILYQQFADTFYEWKQDRFSTTLAQRQQLNRVLGRVALQAFLQPATPFRLSHTFAQQAFGDELDCMTLSLQLGWLNQVGIATTTGQKVYAFYHATFQEYFAAQAVATWRCFWEISGEAGTQEMPVFSSQWREVILLWFGRTDISIVEKDAMMQSLINFVDSCGGFYRHRAYFLAAAALAEFPASRYAEAIVQQLIAWRFGAVPSVVSEGARVALLQTDRPLAIVALEQFLSRAENPFARWQAAYSLGRTFDPGNPLAIATLTDLIDMLQSESLQLQVIETLGKVDPGNPLVQKSLETMLATTQQDTIQRRAAYSLGKMMPGHPQAIALLESAIQAIPNVRSTWHIAENLVAIDPDNIIAITALQSKPQKSQKSRARDQLSATPPHLDQRITTIERQLRTVTDPDNRRRLAYRLAKLQPGHPQAIDCLLQLLLSLELPKLYRRVVEDLKEVLLFQQLTLVVSRVSVVVVDSDRCSGSSENILQWQECYKLLWYCAQRLSAAAFCVAWRAGGSSILAPTSQVTDD